MSTIFNRKARYLYNILETYEAGLVLAGGEVKSVKSGHADLKGAYARIKMVKGAHGQVAWRAELINCYIPPYSKAVIDPKYDPRRTRTLLLKATEMRKLMGALTAKNLTIVPISLYTRKRLVKVQLGLGQGKNRVDKRDDLKKRDIARDVQREVFRK